MARFFNVIRPHHEEFFLLELFVSCLLVHMRRRIFVSIIIVIVLVRTDLA